MGDDEFERIEVPFGALFSASSKDDVDLLRLLLGANDLSSSMRFYHSVAAREVLHGPSAAADRMYAFRMITMHLHEVSGAVKSGLVHRFLERNKDDKYEVLRKLRDELIATFKEYGPFFNSLRNGVAGHYSPNDIKEAMGVASLDPEPLSIDVDRVDDFQHFDAGTAVLVPIVRRIASLEWAALSEQGRDEEAMRLVEATASRVHALAHGTLIGVLQERGHLP